MLEGSCIVRMDKDEVAPASTRRFRRAVPIEMASSRTFYTGPRSSPYMGWGLNLTHVKLPSLLLFFRSFLNHDHDQNKYTIIHSRSSLYARVQTKVFLSSCPFLDPSRGSQPVQSPDARHNIPMSKELETSPDDKCFYLLLVIPYLEAEVNGLFIRSQQGMFNV